MSTHTIITMHVTIELSPSSSHSLLLGGRTKVKIFGITLDLPGRDKFLWLHGESYCFAHTSNSHLLTSSTRVQFGAWLSRLFDTICPSLEDDVRRHANASSARFTTTRGEMRCVRVYEGGKAPSPARTHNRVDERLFTGICCSCFDLLSQPSSAGISLAAVCK